MAKRKTRVEAGSGNVFVDLGYADAKERTLKVQLAIEVNRLLKTRGTRFKLSDPVRRVGSGPAGTVLQVQACTPCIAVGGRLAASRPFVARRGDQVEAQLSCFPRREA